MKLCSASAPSTLRERQCARKASRHPAEAAVCEFGRECRVAMAVGIRAPYVALLEVVVQEQKVCPERDSLVTRSKSEPQCLLIDGDPFLGLGVYHHRETRSRESETQRLLVTDAPCHRDRITCERDGALRVGFR